MLNKIISWRLLAVDFRNVIVFFGPRPWHIEIRHRVKKTSTINLFGFETLKLKFRRLKLWKPTVGSSRAPIKPPRGPTLRSPRPKVTSVLTRYLRRAGPCKEIRHRGLPYTEIRQKGVPYGQFSKFHVCFCGLDSGNLKFETVRTHEQRICF